MSEPEAHDGAGTAPGSASTAAPRLDGRPRARVRSWLSAALLVVGCVLAPIAMVASFARTLLVDSDSYVATVAPLAQDPLVLAAVEDRLTTLATTLVATLRQNVDAVIDRTVQRAVSSAAFAQVWRTANLAAHTQLVATMQEESGGPELDQPIDQLTPRELQIAMPLAEGKTTRQVAAALFVSPKTVEYHLRHIYWKFGIDSRAELKDRMRPGSGS